MVKAGDSLWSVAAARLGPDASAAAVARAMNGLWHLNATRIHSGTPDLIEPGERLDVG